MSKANSPYYAAGLADGEADAEAAKRGEDPAGMNPDSEWSGMYRDGYRDGSGDPSAGTLGAFDVDTSSVGA